MTTENKLLELFANNDSKDGIYVFQLLTELLERELESQLIKIEPGCIALVIVTTDKRRCIGLYSKNNQRIKEAIRQCLLELMKKITLTTFFEDFNIDLKLLDTEEENLENRKIKSAAVDLMFPDNLKMDNDVDSDDDSDDNPDSIAAKIGGHRLGSILEVMPRVTPKQHSHVTHQMDYLDDDDEINSDDDSDYGHDSCAEGIHSNTKEE
ncbi:hypothetical protein CHS0354_012444 [Potamilus streckersoni]|uniref:Uncharacterized protein n=1 Tax=Potamilus streckersoni TaxID=2493646 RepID=A0AAE0RW63_9BIVA|nr:hypothetical protein CHS0354_012444 [Potamilus streckersoni]